MAKQNLYLVKNRSDIGAGTRGADMGIDALEVAAINANSDFFNRYPHVDIPTRNDIIYHQDTNIYAKHIKEVFLQCEVLAHEVSRSLKAGLFPLVFSGDHSSAIGSISGIKAAHLDKVIGVIWIDAHADIHSPFTTPSGNMHGMPLAALLQEDHQSLSKNELNSESIEYWNKLKQIGTSAPKIKPEHLVYVGVRDTEVEEDQIIEKLGVNRYGVLKVRKEGAMSIAKKILDQLKDCEMIYISFDVDSLDSNSVSKGTGTPVPKGFYKDEVKELLTCIFQSDKVVCFEIAEVNPLLDNKGNKMAEVAMSIMEEIFS